ncbi:MAG: DUF402 domain-containing protein [Chloroflexi bacterium AL-W]|nr:DUF402 domain-containing protein [Chloroflexi bacterium AL-N1]NOK64976.1 DUF402 domain-containing protein [Chloroflexi bacterium AL-N10]NOK76746.1 DUF402 domain-containing protein [Chloroflexi bacterium AL-N5]NOK84637.1 DUF402 domain-containing protein [Chloroflexi bacterium AL-W]NOK86538.1 DUF402 domain-containing protein [Chloroflexi bacterium AL-N15]
MGTLTVHLLKPASDKTITYQGELISDEHGHILIHARWERPNLDLGYMTFETGDHFYEHYYTNHWFNIFEIRSDTQELKGWYCNVTRPVHIEGDVVYSEDLALDLFVSPDRQTCLRLDEDEFEALGLAVSDTTTYHAALHALAELEHMATHGVAPFDSPPLKMI